MTYTQKEGIMLIYGFILGVGLTFIVFGVSDAIVGFFGVRETSLDFSFWFRLSDIIGGIGMMVAAFYFKRYMWNKGDKNAAPTL